MVKTAALKMNPPRRLLGNRAMATMDKAKSKSAKGGTIVKNAMINRSSRFMGRLALVGGGHDAQADDPEGEQVADDQGRGLVDDAGDKPLNGAGRSGEALGRDR